MKLIKRLIFAAACVLSFSAHAQWQWLDKDGHKVFSDRAPPADVPDKNILKQPHRQGRAGDVPMIAPTQAATSAPKPGVVDKALMDKKKQAEKQAADAEAAKRKAEEERVAKIQAENCAHARQSKAGLDAGGRMTRFNEKGEREFLDDAMRAEEAQRVQGIIDQNCK